MQAGLYVGLSAQIALNRRMETIASNIANSNTAGYRAEGFRFETALSQAGDRSTAFASTGESFLSRRAGALLKTANPLDVAVSGDGYLAVQTSRGLAYTRDGRMKMSASGALLTLNNDPVLDIGGAPILLQPDAGPPLIAPDGMISQGGRQIGAIGLFSIDAAAKIQRSENGTIVPDRAATPVLDFTRNGIAQGFVENANVIGVEEMTRLIAVQRNFESITALMDQSESIMNEAIKTLGANS